MSNTQTTQQLPYLSQKTVTRILALLVLVLTFTAGYFHIQWKNLEYRYVRLQAKYERAVQLDIME